MFGTIKPIDYFSFFLRNGNTNTRPTAAGGVVLQESPHAVGAGAFGNAIFKQHTTLRPSILSSILKQGYRILWIDADTVWLGDAFSVLPDPRRNQTAVVSE